MNEMEKMKGGLTCMYVCVNAGSFSGRSSGFCVGRITASVVVVVVDTRCVMLNERMLMYKFSSNAYGPTYLTYT